MRQVQIKYIYSELELTKNIVLSFFLFRKYLFSVYTIFLFVLIQKIRHILYKVGDVRCKRPSAGVYKVLQDLKSTILYKYNI